ncbi:MAG: AbrB/MazE/SpoVT family DNA-binding domain-containing protein [Patescibacteria group bacterium]
MNGFSTITQKGQVAIPKSIRDYFNIKPSDKIYFEVKNDNIIARRLSSIDEMRGIVKTHRLLSKIEHKRAVKKAVLQKFRDKKLRENIQP